MERNRQSRCVCLCACQVFASFISSLLSLPRFQVKSYILIFDNLSVHKTEAVRACFDGTRIRHSYKCLPPYSPHLNPIESCFLKWKAHIKMGEKNNQTQLLALIEQASQHITPHNCQGWYREVMRWYVHCAQGRPLEDYRPNIE